MITNSPEIHSPEINKDLNHLVLLIYTYYLQTTQTISTYTPFYLQNNHLPQWSCLKFKPSTVPNRLVQFIFTCFSPKEDG